MGLGTQMIACPCSLRRTRIIGCPIGMLFMGRMVGECPLPWRACQAPTGLLRALCVACVLLCVARQLPCVAAVCCAAAAAKRLGRCAIGALCALRCAWRVENRWWSRTGVWGLFARSGHGFSVDARNARKTQALLLLPLV